MDSIGYFDTDGIWIAENKTAFKSYLEKNANIKTVMKCKRYSKTRSTPLNSYYWGVVLSILSNEFGYDPEEFHDLFKNKFNMIVKDDVRIQVPGSTANMTNFEFIEYIDKIKRWALHEFNVYIPEPNEIIGETK